jgi:hypothetical protein
VNVFPQLLKEKQTAKTVPRQKTRFSRHNFYFFRRSREKYWNFPLQVPMHKLAFFPTNLFYRVVINTEDQSKVGILPTKTLA